ncbi:hypothetical protein QR680_008928 [Steinernema hermaphroditum]|uniref:RING-type domain-containing protein n=1 Tax=Steinernema hermaphroditum TaxID=289476 RepID=A0AA39M8Z1_9BILA|nr:hypothetical protein QR680_008928 [Steinernema hermaphroditum]
MEGIPEDAVQGEEPAAKMARTGMPPMPTGMMPPAFNGGQAPFGMPPMPGMPPFPMPGMPPMHGMAPFPVPQGMPGIAPFPVGGTGMPPMPPMPPPPMHSGPTTSAPPKKYTPPPPSEDGASTSAAPVSFTFPAYANSVTLGPDGFEVKDLKPNKNLETKTQVIHPDDNISLEERMASILDRGMKRCLVLAQLTDIDCSDTFVFLMDEIIDIFGDPNAVSNLAEPKATANQIQAVPTGNILRISATLENIVSVPNDDMDTGDTEYDDLRRRAYAVTGGTEEPTYELKPFGDSYLMVQTVTELRAVDKGHVCLDFLMLRTHCTPEIVFSHKLSLEYFPKAIVYRESVAAALSGRHEPLSLRVGDIIRMELRDVSLRGFDFRVSVRGKVGPWRPFPHPFFFFYVGLRCAPDSYNYRPAQLSALPFACFNGSETIPLRRWLLEEPTECTICCEQRRPAVLIPCRHMICMDCAKKVGKCPFCNEKAWKYVVCVQSFSRCAFPGCGCNQIDMVAQPCNCLIGCEEGAKEYKGDICPVCCRWLKRFVRVFV